MKIKKTEKFSKLTPSTEGNFLTNGVNVGRCVLVPAGNDVNKWREITPEEAEQIRAERARVEREKLAQMDAEAMQADNTPAEE